MRRSILDFAVAVVRAEDVEEPTPHAFAQRFAADPVPVVRHGTSAAAIAYQKERASEVRL
jgi:hypothetical protein